MFNRWIPVVLTTPSLAAAYDDFDNGAVVLGVIEEWGWLVVEEKMPPGLESYLEASRSCTVGLALGGSRAGLGLVANRSSCLALRRSLALKKVEVLPVAMVVLWARLGGSAGSIILLSNFFSRRAQAGLDVNSSATTTITFPSCFGINWVSRDSVLQVGVHGGEEESKVW